MFDSKNNLKKKSGTQSGKPRQRENESYYYDLSRSLKRMGEKIYHSLSAAYEKKLYALIS